MNGPADRERLAAMAERSVRRAALAAAHGMPEALAASDALALARTARVPVSADVTADDVFASIYRDEPAADAWLQSNRVHNGHPTLATVPLPDGRVVGILDLRPSLAKLTRQDIP